MAIDPIRTPIPARGVGRLFRCNCCKSSFAKPTNPAWGFWKGLFFWFLSLALTIPLASSAFNRQAGRESQLDSIHPLVIGLGFFLFFGTLVLGVAYVFSSVLSSPRCPDCRSTNFAKPD